MPEAAVRVDRIVNENSNVVYLQRVKLKKDGTPKTIVNNKQKGKKSEVYHFTLEDAKRMLEYFSENEQWLHYLLFVLSCNMARRNGDMRSLTWKHFFNPVTGEFRKDVLEINEQKTDKFANPHINSAVRAAIRLYIEKTGCDPSKDGYNVPICMQLSGTHKGTVLSYDGSRKGIKRAAEQLGIEYNVATHSARKTFGAMSRMIHPNDYDSMELLQTIYNHSDSRTTKHYIGLTKEKTDKYYDDMGEFFDGYVTGDKEYNHERQNPVVTMDVNDLREIIKAAYDSGRTNADSTDAMVHVEAFSVLMGMVEQKSK